MNVTQQNPIYRSISTATKRDSRSIVDDDSNNHQQHEHDDDSEVNGEGDRIAADFNVANVQITPDTFLSMCPALLVQIEQGSCIERQNEATETGAEADPIIQPKHTEANNIGEFWIDLPLEDIKVGFKGDNDSIFNIRLQIGFPSIG